ncbi:MAG: phage tail protein I [Janthinobacterium lividum]
MTPKPATEENLLPDSATLFERALSLGDASSFVTVAFDPDLIRHVKDPALCPIELLPYLAWERSVHEWDPTWPEWRKRNAVASSMELHRRYGTRWGVEQALDELGIGAELDEWFEYAGRPYCFRIRIPVPTGWTTALTSTVYRVAIGAKNARSYLDGLQLIITPDPPPGSPPGTVGSGRSTAFVPIATTAVMRRRIYATTGTYAGVPPAPATVLVGTVATRRSHIYAHT